MLLMPDLDTAVIDPFFAQTTLILICDVHRAHHRPALWPLPALHRQGRRGICEFLGHRRHRLFRSRSRILHVRRRAFRRRHEQGVLLRRLAWKAPTIRGTEYEAAISATVPAVKGGYFPVPPVDSAQDIRGEMLAIMGDMGIKPEKHHHEVATAQHELGFKFNTLTKCGDNMQIYKYVIHQVAAVLWQVGDLHAQADLWRQRLGHACAPVDLEGRQAAVRRFGLCRSVGYSASITSAASSSTPRRSTPSPTR